MRPLFEAPEHPPPGGLVPRPTDTARRFALRVCGALPGYIVPAALLSCLHQAGEALVAVIVGRAVDHAVATGDGRALVFWIALLAVNFAVLSFSYRFGSRIGWLGMNRIQHDVRMLVTDHLLDPRRGHGPGRLIGAQLSVATSDAYLLARGVGLVVYGPAMVVGVLVCAGALFAISWPLSVAVLVGAFVVLFGGDALGGALRRRVGAQQQAVADASGVAADLVDGLRVVKGVGASSAASTRYATWSEQARLTAFASDRAQAANRGALSLVGGLFVVAVGAAAGLMALAGQITPGQLFTVVILGQFVMEPIRGLSTFVVTLWNPSVAAAGRLLEVLREVPPREEGAARDLPVSPGWGVHVETGGRVLEVHPGEHVTLVAETGDLARALDLLTRSADANDDGDGDQQAGAEIARLIADDGTVLDLADLPTPSVRTAILVAPHEAHLFAGSVLDNVGISPRSTPESVAAAVEAAACDQVAEMLPDGLRSPVGEGGLRLSGGQRQRVGLARALAADPSVLVLLDPTSAVDSVTEQHIAAAVGRLRAGRTTIVITPSPAWRRPDARIVDLTSEVSS